MTQPAAETAGIDLDFIRRLDAWLDNHVSVEYKLQPLAQDWARVSKATEERGEAIEALIGMTGQNPRKGVTHHRTHLLDELADVAFTAILAIQHFTKDTEETRLVIERKQQHLKGRIN